MGRQQGPNRLYVANYVSDDVTVIDGNTNLIITTIAVNPTPYAIAANTTTNRIYVTHTGSVR